MSRWIVKIASNRAGIRRRFRGVWRNHRRWWVPGVYALFFLLLLPLQDTNPNSAQAAFDHAMQTLQKGDLVISQLESERGYSQFRVSSPDWAAKFQLLQAETMVRRGMYNDALRLLAGYQPDSNHPEEIIHKLTTEAEALTHQQQFANANPRLTKAEEICKTKAYASCGYMFRVRGISAGIQRHIPEANQYFRACLFFLLSLDRIVI